MSGDDKLKVFTNGDDWFVAASAEQAIEEWNEHVGDDYVADGYGTVSDWEAKPGDEEICIRFEDRNPEEFPPEKFEIVEQADGLVRVNARYDAWAEWNGVGFLCSVNF